MNDPDLIDCFVGLETLGPMLLAVSGGPDSMALLHLAARWVAGLPHPPMLHVATVDHGLRPESAAEAALVAQAAATLGLSHRILTWDGPKPGSRIQERARQARYGLLADQARACGARQLLTAHHADDQAETILLRLGRGSGLSGLAGMRRTTPLAPGIQLVRPFLDRPKADLVAFCARDGIATVDDPSNLDPAYTRARLREKAALLAEIGLDRSALLRLARRLARADDALEAEAERIEKVLAPTLGEGWYDATIDPLRAAPPEIALRVLYRALAHVIGAADGIVAARPPLRLERLERLTERLTAALAARRPLHATLAGARISLDSRGALEIRRESPRRRGVTPPSSLRPI